MKNTFTSFSVLLILFINNILNAQVTLVTFATGFSNPTDIKNAGDNRIFIVEQTGYIRIVDTAGIVNPKPFLDIHTLVSGGGEQGLLGLAFSPDYATDGRFFVNYTDVSGDSHISRFLVSPTNPDSAIAASQETILFVDQPESNHNGGDLHFGVDGYLYCAFGDGGGGGDLHGTIGNGQNMNTFLGKILRINANVPNGYSIPSNNPFFGNANAYDEIWAYGVRNPWRTSFDRITHDYWIGDVGQGTYEEVDFQPASSAGGENYGWRCYEANGPYNTTDCGPMSDYVFPVYNYVHSGTNGCSITGGYVYRGAKFGAMFGKYFQADYCSGVIHSLIPDGTGGWTVTTEGDYNSNDFSAFGEDKYGELYLAGNSTGNIYRVTVSDCTPSAFISASDTINYCGDSYLMSTPSGGGFFYAWFKDGVGVQASGDNTYTATQSGLYYVQALAPNGCSAYSDSVYLSLQSAPVVSFTGLPSFMCLNQGTVNLTGNPLGGTFSGNGISGSTFDPVAAGEGSHTITYSYIALSGCTATATQTVAADLCLSVQENYLLKDFEISPNPGNGKFNLKMTAMKNITSEVEVLNLFGQVCYHQTLQIQNGINNFQFNLKNLSDGIYFLRMKSATGISSQRFVISK